MRLVLQINDKPEVTTYAHHAFINSIISARTSSKTDKALDEVMMDVWIEGFDKKKWSLLFENKAAFSVNDHFYISKAGVGENSECFYYRKCSARDELVVRFDEIQNTAPGAIVNLFISEDDIKRSVAENIGIVRYAMMNNQLSARHDSDFLAFREIDTKHYRWMKLSKFNKDIICSTSCDGIHWETFETINIDSMPDMSFIGINVNNLGSGISQQYEAWLAMNYIQLFDNTQDPIGRLWLDYKMFFYKNFRYEFGYASQFLDIEYQASSFVDKIFDTPISALKAYLSEGYYVAFPLDEYYIKGRDAWKRNHYIHHNLIYGIDEEKDEVYILGYERKLKSTVISTKDYESAYTVSESSVVKYKYAPCAVPFKFSLDLFVDSLNAFLNSESRTSQYISFMSDHPGSCGISALEAFYENEYKRNLFLEDNRISYVIYEHSILMKKKLKYINEKILIDTDLSSLVLKVEEQITKAGILKNMVIKNKILGNTCDYREEILELLRIFIDEEKQLFKEIINCLSRYK